MIPETFIYIAAISAVVAAISSIVMLCMFISRKQDNVRDEFASLRQEVNGSLFNFQSALQNLLNDKNKSQSDVLQQLGSHQKERLEQVMKEVGALTQTLSESQQGMRQTLESRLDAMRTENTGKLDEIRKTVDEQLQTALEKRLTESFKRVSDQLENVHKGLGEMQTLATGVGDLKKVLSGVKTRGIFGELSLDNLLGQFLTPDQYIVAAQVRENSAERVDFAIRLPETLLPIDVKYPEEDYRRLIEASEKGSKPEMDAATSQLCETVRKFAKDISEKYINPPFTTNFAIIYLPTESLYAEMLRHTEFMERLHREYRISLAGPSTLAAQLNALQMGFRTLAVQKRSTEVWKVLGAVRHEFTKYGEVVSKLHDQLDTAKTTLGKLDDRTRIMGNKLKTVDMVTGVEGDALLGLDQVLDMAGKDEALPLVANIKK
jgi:DNA recombination protein RmuC